MQKRHGQVGGASLKQAKWLVTHLTLSVGAGDGDVGPGGAPVVLLPPTEVPVDTEAPPPLYTDYVKDRRAPTRFKLLFVLGLCRTSATAPAGGAS